MLSWITKKLVGAASELTGVAKVVGKSIIDDLKEVPNEAVKGWNNGLKKDPKLDKPQK